MRLNVAHPHAWVWPRWEELGLVIDPDEEDQRDEPRHADEPDWSQISAVVREAVHTAQQAATNLAAEDTWVTVTPTLGPLGAAEQRIVDAWLGSRHSAPTIDLLHRWSGGFEDGRHRAWGTRHQWRESPHPVLTLLPMFDASYDLETDYVRESMRESAEAERTFVSTRLDSEAAARNRRYVDYATHLATRFALTD